MGRNYDYRGKPGCDICGCPPYPRCARADESGDARMPGVQSCPGIDLGEETMHTKGPWTVSQPEKYQGSYEIAEAIDGEHEGNRDLIAAAPELLEACKTAFANLQRRSETRQKWTVRDQNSFEALEDAIRKARGGEI